MARTKEFDPDTALQAALELFQARGYEATSMADLVEHLGVAKASMYATFGSKHDLYLKALQRYLDARPDPLAMLSQPGPALPAVRALVRLYAEEAANDVEQLGCFVVNTAIELAPHDRAAARAVQQAWDRLETAIISALVRAAAQGELPAGRDPYALGRLLLTVLQGIRVLAKGGPDPVRIREAAEQALERLV
ncbi:TetR/AcrR family transcriptional regulator [Nonomuraea sp. NPDC050556]|uniref:TetR/AcrR family transcriptional regulator n=1 Tax=Nonomuraea sp. NPDC050556 TaxID=3364369 RepID=UPI0037B64D51